MADAEAEAVVNTKLVVYEGDDDVVSAIEKEQEAPEAPVEGTAEASEEIAEVQDVPDNKRKLEDVEPLINDESLGKKQKISGFETSAEVSLTATDQVTPASEVAAPETITQETEGPGHSITEEAASVADGMLPDSAQCLYVINGNFEQQSNQDKEPDELGLVDVKVEEQSLGSGQIPSSEEIEHASANDSQHLSSAHSQDDHSLSMHNASYDIPSTAYKIDVPNDKVGVLIGKYGETIKNLQMNSGAKIQITRDTDVDPYSSTRIVELIGTLESVNKAEELIKNVIAEADAGGSPALVARGFGGLQSGDEQAEVQVPNEKVGMIIGKGGETIKNIQTKSGARVQLIPQHLPKGDSSKDRTVRITGSNKQVESAKEMINDILNQTPTRHSNTFRPPHGSGPATHWGPRSAAPPQQTPGYNQQQRGMYPPSQYSQPYGGYSQQPPSRATYGSTWVQQRPAAAPMQTIPQPGGYDYYNQAGPVHNNPLPNPAPGSGPASAPSSTNYNYYQQQPPDAYGHSAPYTQPPPAQQKYVHGYSNEPKYDTQPPGQQAYAQQQPMGPQSGMYGLQSATPYGQPAYGAPQDVARVAQPVDQMYNQGVPQNQYPSSAPPMQQQYPYASPAQQAPHYSQQAYGPGDGYSQQPAAGYAQSAPGYVQGGQAAPPAYGQSVVPQSAVPQSAGYSQYPSSQPSYGDQVAQSGVNYGYQGAPADSAYGGTMPSSGYASQQPAASQPGYSTYYDQSMQPPSGYIAAPAAAPIAAPVAYAKSVSPQPGYGGGQYDSGQAYAHH